MRSGLKAEDAKRLKDLERENATLKRLLADELEKAALATLPPVPTDERLSFAVDQFTGPVLRDRRT